MELKSKRWRKGVKDESKIRGPSFGVDRLTDGRIYICTGIEYGNPRIIDDSGEDYLYSAINLGQCDNKRVHDKWEIVEDNESESLQKLIK